MSIAAQFQNPEKCEVSDINKRIKWQIDNMSRLLTYVPLDLSTAKLYVFVDGSLAKNKDLSSRIGFVIAITNEQPGEDQFTINGNLLHWSSTKSKHMTRSSLASEILTMVGGVDIGIAICSTLLLYESMKISLR
ncbi:hypothetical protein K3495_g13540 [Podosphaera aphanis]|nr:hypothetical protein K3495_g13540 [Podosphaera aphanis]